MTMATKREQIANFLNKNGFASTFKGDQFEQVINAIELYTNKKENKPKKHTLSPEILEGFKESAKIFNSFFPEVKIPTSGKYARDPEKEVTEALIWFIPTYGFEMDIVFKAVQLYVNEYEMKGWNYMQTSKYFIRKQQKDKTWVSNLANYCQQVSGGVEIFVNKIPDLKNRVV